MEVPKKSVAQAHTVLERQLAEMKDIINRLEAEPATKADGAHLLDIWYQLEHVKEVLQVLRFGAASDMP